MSKSANARAAHQHTTNSANTNGRGTVLSPESLTSVLSCIELLSAMWSGHDELVLSAQDEAHIHTIAQYLQLPLEQLGSDQSLALKHAIPNEVQLGLKIRPPPRTDLLDSDTPGASGGDGGVRLNVVFKCRGKSSSESSAGGEGRRMEMVKLWTSAVDAPSWLDRAGVEEVNSILGKYGVVTQSVGGQPDATAVGGDGKRPQQQQNEQEQEEDDDDDVVGKILTAIEQVSEYLLTINTTTSSSTTAAQTPPHPPPPSLSSSSSLTNTSAAAGKAAGVAPNESSTHTSSSSSSFSTLAPPSTLSTSSSSKRWVRRTWYYLPSLSTPSKRKDICHLANTSSPPLTGFLLAGKPGLIVLEYPLSSFASSGCAASEEESRRAALAMFAFWSEIKTTSWSDIPSSHKKISERLVEESTPQAFQPLFVDITDDPQVERGADRGRKSDLSKLIKWLDNKGVSGKMVIEKCLGVANW